ncbi:MAG: sigma-70 family RNA polymerase sigma factor [Alphaproteobacteria bacterium]|nr:sigma-70 family RNA polymerase sigma factor [Alphaproteobacteria bacterium]
MKFGKNKAQDAFREAVKTELDALYRTACRMLYDRTEAEDAVQESLDKAWRNLHRFKPDGQMRPWLFAILNNTCLDNLRARARRINVPFDPETAQDLGLLSERDLPEQAVANQQLGRQIEEQIAALPPDHRAAVQLVIVEQLSYAEAAEALDLPIGTLRSRLSRARASLCVGLSEHLEDGEEKDPDSERPAKLRLVR